jgi:hypothetical protein
VKSFSQIIPILFHYLGKPKKSARIILQRAIAFMTTDSNYWGEFFANWPAELPRRGIVVTSFNEQIVFSTFWTSGSLLMLERQTPDSLGARSIVIPYDQILALKITDIVKAKSFKAAGFDGVAAKP